VWVGDDTPPPSRGWAPSSQGLRFNSISPASLALPPPAPGCPPDNSRARKSEPKWCMSYGLAGPSWARPGRTARRERCSPHWPPNGDQLSQTYLIQDITSLGTIGDGLSALSCPSVPNGPGVALRLPNLLEKQHCIKRMLLWFLNETFIDFNFLHLNCSKLPMKRNRFLK